MCKLCRFRRCLDLGMRICSKYFKRLLFILILVESTSTDTSIGEMKEDPIIRQILAAQRKTFASRFKEALKVSGGNLVRIIHLLKYVMQFFKFMCLGTYKYRSIQRFL